VTEIAAEGGGEVDAVRLEAVGSVVGDDGDVERGNAKIVGAKGDAPFAQGALEARGGAASGEAAVALGGIGVEEGLGFGPGGHEDLFEVEHRRECTAYVRYWQEFFDCERRGVVGGGACLIEVSKPTRSRLAIIVCQLLTAPVTSSKLGPFSFRRISAT
jgi:hypothetical protein